MLLLGKLGSIVETHASIVIVDSPNHEHGRMVLRFARIGNFTPGIQWLEPSLSLPEDLKSVRGVAAVAMPLGVRGATIHDRFTMRLMNSIKNLMTRGIPVFVAAGSNRSNLLAQIGIAVSTRDILGSGSTSEACVRAAAERALQSCKQGYLDKP